MVFIRSTRTSLGDESTLEQNIAKLFETVGSGIDHVIHTAGASLAIKNLNEIDMSFIKKAGLVRFFAPLFIGKYAPKYMNPGPKSSITLTTGGVAERPHENWTVVNSYATGIIPPGMSEFGVDIDNCRVNHDMCLNS